MEIRPSEARDQAGIRKILSACGWSAAQIEGQSDAIRALAPLDSGIAAVAIYEGDLVGFVTAQFYGWNRIVQIHGLAVDPDLRRGGIGSRLVEAAEDFARARGARGIYADTPVDNNAGRELYTDLDFTEAYVMPRFYSEELDGVTFQKFFD